MNELFEEILKYLRHTRARVREAEFFHAREGAQMLDTVGATLGAAFEHEKAGRHEEALAVLRDAQKNDLD